MVFGALTTFDRLWSWTRTTCDWPQSEVVGSVIKTVKWVRRHSVSEKNVRLKSSYNNYNACSNRFQIWIVGSIILRGRPRQTRWWSSIILFQKSVLSSQVKLVLTLKTVKEKLVREKVQVGGENLTTINLEVTHRIAKCCRYDKCLINLIKMVMKILVMLI